MAIDTRDKRLSVIGYGLGLRPLPTPDSVVAAAERRMLGRLYSGVAINVDWTVRASMVNLTFMYMRPMKYPEATISGRDRQQVLGLYHEIYPATPAGSVIVFAHTVGRAIGRALRRSM